MHENIQKLFLYIVSLIVSFSIQKVEHVNLSNAILKSKIHKLTLLIAWFIKLSVQTFQPLIIIIIITVGVILCIIIGLEY